MVERQLPKLHTRVRFPSPAPLHGASLSLHRVHRLDGCCCRTAPHHPLERGSRRRGRVSAVAAPHTVPVFQRALCRRAYTDPADGDRSALVCACVPIANVSVIATMSAFRISASPVFLRLRARSTVNRCADEERRGFFAAPAGPSTASRTNRKATVLPEKAGRSENGLPFFFRIWPP
jgi:hypothetical protein